MRSVSPIKYKLDNIEALSKLDIDHALMDGAKFILFKYQISLFAVSLPRLSPAILIRDELDLARYKKKYNLISLFFGPWFFIKGPFFVYEAIKFNNTGGLDITKDITINLENFNQEDHTVEISTIHSLFAHLPKDEFKELNKAIADYCSGYNGVRELFVGQYINVDEYTEPPYYIFVDTDKEKKLLEDELRGLIYKRFNKFVHFTIYTKREDVDLFERIKEQGQKIPK